MTGEVKDVLKVPYILGLSKVHIKNEIGVLKVRKTFQEGVIQEMDKGHFIKMREKNKINIKDSILVHKNTKKGLADTVPINGQTRWYNAYTF